ncbi:hypothetical protein DSCO28_61800 [Desulfosarcina ovata subsp. sediminis]|uniref:histidine kinase n=1 Tax=Desulfosarcina ovata subsp. sediminis TaxID=885957 RepID=A0A5K7ZZP3_9BACT|nr:sensor histidine kinase [Desulfosarcina ovata]BBO85614.1 hypothetical protein DSCO28_61800 [Desulfosarcina ovata subsp. sediminis]
MMAPHNNSENPLLKAAYRFLAIANTVDNEDAVFREFVTAIKDVSGCDAVGIRTHHDTDWLTYSAHEGFSDAFLGKEASLHLEDDRCFCTRVFHQQTDPAQPFYTDGGSFVTNHADRLLHDPVLSDPGPLRGTCIQAGYRSLGLFPIRSLDQVLGLVHVADSRPERFSPDLIVLLEHAALQLGVSIEKTRALARLRGDSHDMASPVHQRGNQLKTVVATLNAEIRQRRLAEKELKQSRHLLQLVFESISDPLILMDEKAQVIMVNRAAMKYYDSKSVETALGRFCFEGLGQFSTVCQTCRIPSAVADGRAMEFERDGFRDWEKREVVQLFPIKDVSGKIQGAVMQVHDVTGTRYTQDQLNRLQTQASLGMLVSSVAHEIKNPNSFIAFNISVLHGYVTDLLPVLDAHAAANPDFEVSHVPYEEFRRDVFKLIETIDHGSRRIDLFLRNLKTLGLSRPKIKCTSLSLPEVISKVLDTVRSKIEKTVSRFEVQIKEPLPAVYSDAGIIEQVILNLLVNAAQAADKGDAYIRLIARLSQKDDQRVIFMVEDNGHGMDPQTQRQIFEPFYSTKIAEGGTGLGLYVCRNLIRDIGGRLYLESEVGKGSRFTVELPVNAPGYRENGNAGGASLTSTDRK